MPEETAATSIARLAIPASIVLYVLLGTVFSAVPFWNFDAVKLWLSAGVPVWWKLTAIHRPQLPAEDMLAAAARTNGTNSALPVNLTVYYASSGALMDYSCALIKLMSQANSSCTGDQERDVLAIDFEQLTQLIIGAAGASWPIFPEKVTMLRESPGGCVELLSPDSQDHSSSLCLGLCTAKPWLSLDAAQLDNHLHSLLHLQGLDTPGSYFLVILPADEADGDGHGHAPGETVVGQHRSSWLWADPRHPSGDLKALQPGIAAAVQTMLGGPGAAAASPHLRSLPLSPAGSVVLSFSLCNAELAGETWSWDFERLEEQYLRPMLGVLRPVARVGVESQVLYYAPARVSARWSSVDHAFVVDHEQLPFFVDSNWNLDFGRMVLADASAEQTGEQATTTTTTEDLSSGASIPSHVLHFVVYVPPRGQRPMRVRLPSGSLSATDSFYMPDWGAVIVLNPEDFPPASPAAPAEPCNNTTTPAGAAAPQDAASAKLQDAAEQLRMLPADAVHRLAGLAAAQLHALLGMGGEPGPGAARQLPAASSFALWQVDALVRRVVAEQLVGSCRTLGSLAKLAQELPNLEMPDLIGQQVEVALQAAERGKEAVRRGDYEAAAVAARLASASAEAAFSHPAVLAQLNFPDSHKLGVYLPFFMPVLVALAQSMLRELWRYRKERNRHKPTAPAEAHGEAGQPADVADVDQPQQQQQQQQQQGG